MVLFKTTVRDSLAGREKPVKYTEPDSGDGETQRFPTIILLTG